MKNSLGICLIALLSFSSCNSYNKILKSADYEYKYEAAKEYYFGGKYSRAATILEELIAIMKGTDKGEESLFMLGMSYYGMHDYETASHYFKTYYSNYPRGIYTELARFYTGKTLYLATPEPRLDQTATVKAIQELQLFLEYYPESERRDEINNMLYSLQDNLAEKELYTATLYYNLGSYTGNYGGHNSGNNYDACIITAQNAQRDYPYSKHRESLAFLVLKAKYQLAMQSVDEKKQERLTDATDEYYAFKNEYPSSKHMTEADKILKAVSKKSDGSATEQ